MNDDVRFKKGYCSRDTHSQNRTFCASLQNVNKDINRVEDSD